MLEWVVPNEDLTIAGNRAQVCLLRIIALVVDNPNDSVDRLSMEVLISLGFTEEATLNLVFCILVVDVPDVDLSIDSSTSQDKRIFWMILKRCYAVWYFN